MNDVLNTQNHTLRRSIGHQHFSNLANFQKATSSRKFTEEIELMLNDRMRNNLTVSVIPVRLGRKELEERICEKFFPKYNTRGKRGKDKVYTKADKQVDFVNAYEPWTKEDDEKLERLFCEGKKIKELCLVFSRNEGAIHSRIRKLGLIDKYGN